MDSFGPLQQIKNELLFSFAPTEFEFLPGKLMWESPCWLSADIVLRPLTPASREAFLLNVLMPHRWDAFAKASWEEQLWAAFAPRLRDILGQYRNDWWKKLWGSYSFLKGQIQNVDQLFPLPFRFMKREAFAIVGLPTILKEKPETLSIYLATEKRRYSEYSFLRIHSSPPFAGAVPRCLWFEKRLPGGLHVEDVLPWFAATICRLPRKQQPVDIEEWKRRLLEFEPDLASSANTRKESWTDRSKVVFVFGPTCKVGYRSLFHFERRDIAEVLRKGKFLTIKGATRHLYADNSEVQLERIVFIVAADADACKRVERQIFDGEKVHFGLDCDIVGMIVRSGEFVHAMNVSVEIVRSLALGKGEDIRLESNPRRKHRLYLIAEARPI